jgi:hypothetical protein
MHLLGYGPQRRPPYTRNVLPLLPRETWIPTDLQNRVAFYLDSPSVHNLNRTCREWSQCGGDNGEHKHVHVTSANIESILVSRPKPIKLPDIGYEVHSVSWADSAIAFRFRFQKLRNKRYPGPRNLCISFTRLFNT